MESSNNPLKTYSTFYTPKLSSYYSDDIRNLLHEKISNRKKLTQKGKKIPIISNVKKGNTQDKNIISQNINIKNYLNDIKNRNFYIYNIFQNNIHSNTNESQLNKNIIFPTMFYNYNKTKLTNNSNIKVGLSHNLPNYKNKNDIKIKIPFKTNINNYMNIINYKNIYNNNKDNKESVEWMLYNKNKKKLKNSNRQIDVLDRLTDLKKYNEYIEMMNNIIPPLLESNANYNYYNDFKKRHSKDYLLVGNNNNNHRKKSVEIKDIKKDNNLCDNDNDLNKMIKKKKLYKFNILSVPGSHNGSKKINQDFSLILQNINDCNNVKVFGVFDGHGNYGDKITQEICEYFDNFFNNKKLYENDKNDDNENNLSESIKFMRNKKKINFKNKKHIYRNEEKINKGEKTNNENENNKINLKIKKSKTNAITFNNIKLNKYKQLTPNSSKRKEYIISKFKNIKSMFNVKNSKNKKIKNIYNVLSLNNYSQIFNSFNNIDKILHQKYDENRVCHGSGTSLSLLFLFNDYYVNNNNNINNEKNFNKIITTNLGNTKSILITDDKKIKELNICHTPCIKEERLRIEENGGKIDKIDWLKVGPLRVWFKDKKYPGLSITRSLGDFEAKSLGILSIPDIKEFDIDEEKIKIIVMGTNGIWEFLTNDKIMDIVLGYYECEDVNGATQKVIETAEKLWKIKNPKNIPDLTVIVLFFK